MMFPHLGVQPPQQMMLQPDNVVVDMDAYDFWKVHIISMLPYCRPVESDAM